MGQPPDEIRLRHAVGRNHALFLRFLPLRRDYCFFSGRLRSEDPPLLGDVAVDDRTNPRAIKVHLRRSKTDQFGNGVDVVVGKTGDALCPVAAVCAFIAHRGSSPGPFFTFADHTPLTKPKLVEILRAALDDLGLPQEQFAGRSFRIGAATTAAQVGLEDSVIRMLGRWNSRAFLRYIRASRDSLAKATARLTRGHS